MPALITPRELKGFRDFLPADEAARRELVCGFESVFRRWGFVPIDTPALEYAEVLLGKSGGETEKQIYRFKDNGGRDVALRFDLTVPFARFAAEHRALLPMPFKRYHIAKVWRGENTQLGRYREFTQCDFDIAGTSSAASDAEILLLIHAALSAVNSGGVTIRVNHRGLFNQFLAKHNIGDKLVDVLRAVDKLAKIGRERLGEILSAIAGDGAARAILQFIDLSGSWEEVLAAMTGLSGGASDSSKRLEEIMRILKDSACAARFVLDPSITRGLDYYTGVVFETALDSLPSIGSICSGGRYDNLTALYSKEPLPGVGASIGLDRLIAALESSGRPSRDTPFALCAIACVHQEHSGQYQRMAGVLREAGVSCEVNCEEKKLSAQFVQAEKKGTRFVIVPAEQAPFESELTVRRLDTRSDTAGLSLERAVSLLI
ncbi:MAG: histidine--tRNA ligase [Spirochaetaceae bacterium]|jgi:histidyl-tRNA synthetase|nr:histidine--tRNA ligase [Spirochaetaceae bacterium]